MRKKCTALTLIFTMAASLLLGSVNVYAAKGTAKETEEQNPTIEVTFSTGTQQNAKDKLDEAKAQADEDDGSFDEVVLIEEPADEDLVEIHIGSTADFVDFSKKCWLDTWSVNKVVYLDADLILTGSGFETVPTFGGIFEGNGHTIEGLIYSAPVSNYGVFSNIQETGVVKNLNVKATIHPEGKQVITGGICGNNSGQIVNCSFDGIIDAYDYVGGICGYNELSGIISGCSAKGTVTGAHYTGGIAGENVGLISNCINSADINTVMIERGMTLEEMDIASVTSGLFGIIGGEGNDEKKEKTTVVDSGSIDTGGISGLSIGVIQFCTNNGNVGYEHVGYNTGGICGRQSGYINSCTNKGLVYGRKDIGGIVGQAEPYVVVDFTEDVINKLSTSIDELHDIVGTTIDDASDESNTVSARLKVIQQFTNKALDETSFLSDRTVEWTDGMVASVNDLSGRADYIMRESSKSDGPIDNTEEAFDHTKDAADNLEKTVNDLDIYRYMDDSQKTRYNDAKDRFEYLSKELSKNEAKYSKAAENYYIYKLRNDQDGGVDKYPNASDTTADGKLKALKADGTDITSSLSLSPEPTSSNWRGWDEVDKFVHSDGTDFGSKEGDSQLAKDASTELSNAGTTKHPNKSDVNDSANTDTITAYNSKYGTAITDSERELADQAGTMAGIIAAITPAMDAATRADATKAADDLKKASDDLSDAGSDTKHILRHVADQGRIVFPELGSEYRERTNSLVEALQGMSDNMGLLNDEMASGNNAVFGDMDGVNDKFNEIMQLYTDAIDGVLDNDYENAFDDQSMLVAEICTDATLANCLNEGRIEGDIDVSGIAGAMGIEYDFDLESDITGKKDANFSSTYQTKCVLRADKNKGLVKSQKSYLGGVCGLQEMGTILHCENYGKLRSANGEYVGGIAGDSYSYIQKSYAKATLYGNRFVGGIAGHGTNIANCYSLVDIPETDGYFGAIAGSVEEDGKVRYNYFVSDKLAGIDRISYSQKAEPVAYDVLTSVDSIPSEFKTIYVTFALDDDEDKDDDETVIKTIMVNYGDSVDSSEFPEVSDKDGSYAGWEVKELTDLVCDTEVMATYTRYKTTIASEQTRSNSQSAILVDGEFHEDDKLTCVLDYSDIPDIKDVKEHWTIDYNYDGKENHLVRFMKPDNMERDAVIYISHAGKWEKVDTTLFGSYSTFEISGSHAEIAIAEAPADYTLYIVGAVIAVIILIAVVIVIKKIKKRKNG